jgi:hypothetical protein
VRRTAKRSATVTKVVDGLQSTMVPAMDFSVPRMTESKMIQTDLSTLAPINTTPVILEFIGGVIPGSGTSQRIGRLITVKRVTANFQLQGGQANGVLDDRNNLVRIMICTGARALTAANFSSWTIITNRDIRYSFNTFAILYDKRISLVSPGRDSTGYMPALQEISLNIRLNLRVAYAADAAGSEDIGIYLVAVSDSAAAPNPFIANGAAYVEYLDC